MSLLARDIMGHLERRKLEDRPSVKSDPVRWNFSLGPVLEKTSDQIAEVRYTADASHTRKETAYDEEMHGATAPLATPASRRPPHPASPGSTCCRAASPTRGTRRPRPANVDAGVRTSCSQWRDSPFGRSAGQGRRRALLGELVKHLSRRDALRAEGT